MISPTLRRACQESAVIILVSVAMGFLYTALMQRGLFAERQSPAAVDSSFAPRFVLYDEAVQLYQAGEATFVDARHSFDFDLGHIKGAINIPLNTFASAELNGIPRDRILVVYCDGQECNSSIDLAKKVASYGFRNVRIFFGGWREWSNNRQPTQP